MWVSALHLWCSTDSREAMCSDLVPWATFTSWHMLSHPALIPTDCSIHSPSHFPGPLCPPTYRSYLLCIGFGPQSNSSPKPSLLPSLRPSFLPPSFLSLLSSPVLSSRPGASAECVQGPFHLDVIVVDGHYFGRVLFPVWLANESISSPLVFRLHQSQMSETDLNGGLCYVCVCVCARGM